jgi:hypothetical protein
MLFNVPQFINIEDKVVGPLTAKQLGWLGAGGVVLLVCWNVFDTQAFFVSVVIVGIIFRSLAFYRPYNQPLINFIFSSISFGFRPKLYVWKRESDAHHKKKIVRAKTAKHVENKKIDQEKISEITRRLDLKK